MPNNRNHEGVHAASDAMKAAIATTPAFDHLARVNRANIQTFFLKGFSHKFNNPLNTILLGGELLQNYVHDIEMLFDLLESESEHPQLIIREIRDRYLSTMPDVIHGINSSARSLNRFISHLSEFTGHGNIAGSRDVDLNQLASLCLSMTDHRIRAFTDNFHIDLATGIPPFTGNAQQMLQVIHNLLMNSLLALPDRSCQVVLSTSCNRGTGLVQLCMRDTGTGMSPDILPHVVEPFFTTWSEQGCMGLGLTVSDRIIRNHDGELSIDSAPGRGTSVLVSLPVRERTADCRTERNHG